MNDMKSLDQLRPIAEEMLGGLRADEHMRLAIVRTAQGHGTAAVKKTTHRLVPAVCCAALALACVGVTASHMERRNTVMLSGEPVAVSIDTIAAGDEAEAAAPMTRMMPELAGGASVMPAGRMVADLGDNAMVSRAMPGGESLFAVGEGDVPLVTVDGAFYQMLTEPADVENTLLSGQVGSVQRHDEQPSLASPSELSEGLSNVAGEGVAIYALAGLPQTTAVAAEVDGSMRVFQRVSYAGKGPAGSSLEDTFSVRGKVTELELSGEGTLTGEKANEVIAVLLDQAVLKSADASTQRQTLTVTLENGLRLQLGVSGDTLCGCGGWSCPEFFEAFETARSL